MDSNKKLAQALARMESTMSKIDWDFVDAAHVERDRSYRPDSPTQAPIKGNNPDNLPSIEFYAPTQVSVLGFPVLYCMVCAIEHPCAWTHRVDANLGVCEPNHHVVKPESYALSERVQTTAEQSHTGTLTRA